MTDNRTTELLPCPFCGGRQTYRKHDGGVLLTTTNHKRGCIMRDALAFVAFDTEAEAIAAWNSRAERTCRIEHVKSGAMYDVWRCSACGYEYAESVSEESIVQNYCPNCGSRVVE